MEDIRQMPLVASELPSRFENFQPSRESELDNKTMAEHGFPGSDAERFRGVGRIGGYMREFVSVVPSFGTDGVDFMVATVAHLFDTPDAVHGWMHDVFLKDFEANIGVDIGNNQKLVATERLRPAGFFDEAGGAQGAAQRQWPPDFRYHRGLSGRARAGRRLRGYAGRPRAVGVCHRTCLRPRAEHRGGGACVSVRAVQVKGMRRTTQKNVMMDKIAPVQFSRRWASIFTPILTFPQRGKGQSHLRRPRLADEPSPIKGEGTNAIFSMMPKPLTSPKAL